MTSSSDLRRWMVAVAVVAAVAAGAGTGGRASYGARTTADEPHYLLTAISLAEDRDLDVSDEIDDERYRPFSEIGLNVQSRPLDGGRLVSPHDPLLPALLAPAVAAGGWVAAKLALAALAGVLAAAVLWVAVRRYGVPLVPAGAVVAVFAASPPLSVYGTQVYPELPAALAVVAAAGMGAGAASRRSIAGVIVAITALPWLSIKYAPVAAALAAVVAWRWWAAGERRAVSWLAGGLAASGIAFAAAHWAWYGGWTPYGVGDHFVTGEFGVVGFDPDFAGRSRRLIGLLVDREFGLAAWQPAWLFALPAGAAFAARRHGAWSLAAIPAAVGWLNATFVALTMHGWWWPGRQVVVVAPLVVVMIASWVAVSRRRLAAFLAAGAAGILAYVFLTVEVLTERLTLIVDFFDTANPLYRAWAHVLPDYRHVTAETWLLHALWIAAALLALAWGARRPSSSPGP